MVNLDRLYLLILLLLLSGCFAKNPEYPLDWPALRQSKDIENELVGSFSCYGKTVRTDRKWDRSYLPYFLFLKESSIRCKQLDIQRSETGMEFRYSRDGIFLLKHEYEKNRDYTTNDGWLVLEPDSSWFTSGIVDARTSIKRNITLNDSGDLVIKAKRSSMEMIFYVPALGASETVWGTFKRFDESDVETISPEKSSSESLQINYDRTPKTTFSPDCKMSESAKKAIEQAKGLVKSFEDQSSVCALIDQAENAASPPECDSARAKILADKAIEMLAE